MSSEQELSEAMAQRLREVRSVLMRLHKTLLEFERQAYEREHGRISNSYKFLQLVMSDAWFAWLRQLSDFIVEMDELLAAREAPSESTALALIEQSRILLTSAELGSEFQRKYFTAMQQSPEVVVAHSEFTKVLGPARLTKEIH